MSADNRPPMVLDICYSQAGPCGAFQWLDEVKPEADGLLVQAHVLKPNIASKATICDQELMINNQVASDSTANVCDFTMLNPPVGKHVVKVFLSDEKGRPVTDGWAEAASFTMEGVDEFVALKVEPTKLEPNEILVGRDWQNLSFEQRGLKDELNAPVIRAMDRVDTSIRFDAIQSPDNSRKIRTRIKMRKAAKADKIYSLIKTYEAFQLWEASKKAPNTIEATPKVAAEKEEDDWERRQGWFRKEDENN
jgi:hypothetical protein